MSQSISQLKLIKVSDNRINDNEEKSYCIVQGGQLITYRYFNPASISQSSMTFNNINPPDLSVYTSKYVSITLVVLIDFVGTTSGVNLLDGWGTTMALRAMPVNNSQINATLTLNNSSFTQEMNDVLPYILRCRFQKMMETLSETPVYLDASQEYSELSGAMRNPLGGYQNSVNGSVIPRGGFNMVEVLSNTPTTGQLRVTCTEPILISPLDFMNCDNPYFAGLSTVTYQGTFDPDINSRFLSISDNSPASFSSISITPQQETKINFTYITPSVATQIPKTMVFPFYKINKYVTDFGSLAAGATITNVASNIQISSIPKRLVLFIRQKRSTLNPSVPDVFARITGLSIQFMNKSSLLGSASAQQLYDISRFNGVDLNWQEWFGSNVAGSFPSQVSGVGAVIVIDPATDLGLDNLQSAGMTMNTQLQVTFTYTNLNKTNALFLSSYILTVDDGLVTINNGASYIQNSVVGVNDLLNLSESPPEYTTADALLQSKEGGNIFGNIKSFIQKNLPLFKQIFDVGKQVAPIIAPLFGMGDDEGMGMEGLGLVGGRRRHRGRGLVGGAQLDRMRLANLID